MCKACEFPELCQLKELNGMSIENFKTLICKKNYFHVMEELKLININLAMNYKVNKIYLKYKKKIGFDFSMMRN
jgi:hypothetical protein